MGATSSKRADISKARKALSSRDYDGAMAAAFGPGKVQVRKTRTVHWPNGSEVRARGGEVLWANDPWLEGQHHKCSPYSGDEEPLPIKDGMTRDRVRDLTAKLQTEEPAAPSTRQRKVAKTTARKRDELETTTDDELAGLDG